MSIRVRPARPRPGQRPPTTRVPEGRVVYAVGDVHGRADLLAELLAAIAADSARRPPGPRVLVPLGDYWSRGPAVRRVLDLVTAGLPGFRTVALKGNHEDLIDRFLAGDLVAGRQWLQHGGMAALAEYGIDAGRAPDLSDPALSELRVAFRAAMPAAHRAFLDQLAVCHREGNVLFVHAGIAPGVPVAQQDPRHMMWIREPFLSSEVDHGVVVVHGHQISAKPQVRFNRIGIDTGAYKSGRLTALALAGSELLLLQTD